VSPRRRARLERAVGSVDGEELRGRIAVWFVVGLVLAVAVPAGAAVAWAVMAAATVRYVRHELHVGALLADEDRHARTLERIPSADLRGVASG
jgi:hypothetical protein